ncbi:HD domain-containing phosphohydrolase [Lachnospiraceae bacterium 66-29]
MRYIKINHVRPGMRLARPIYNKNGVMLFERDTHLTPQGINSIRNFGLWGLYILEPAEPVPPLSDEDVELERYLTVSTFRLKDDLTLLLNNMMPRNIMSMGQEILRKFGGLDHKVNFIGTLRSSGDYVYKHSLNTAILAAMMVNRLHYDYSEQLAIVCAALLHDVGLLMVPDEILEKGQRLLSPDERRLIRGYLEKGYQMLHPDYNDYKLPNLSLQIIRQMTRLERQASSEHTQNIRWKNGTHVLYTASMFDEMTSMNLDREPISELAAIRFLREHTDHFPAPYVTALTQCIHILPTGRCVEFSNGQTGIIIEENQKNYAQPVMILFSNNERVDFTDVKFQKALHIADIMKTMDNRLKVDRATLKQYKSDPKTREQAKRYLEKRKKLVAAGRL